MGWTSGLPAAPGDDLGLVEGAMTQAKSEE